jgi:hypothetical protein
LRPVEHGKLVGVKGPALGLEPCGEGIGQEHGVKIARKAVGASGVLRR